MKGPSGKCVLTCDNCSHLDKREGYDYDGPRTRLACRKKHMLPINGGTPEWCPLLHLAKVEVFPQRKAGK